jgi:hypothetical protein
MWHKIYYFFTPDKYWWNVVILGRKLLIAFTSLMFRSYATYQLALALLVMFAAFVLQVVHRPYITALNKASVLKAHEEAALTSSLHATIAVSNCSVCRQLTHYSVRLGRLNCVATLELSVNQLIQTPSMRLRPPIKVKHLIV